MPRCQEHVLKETLYSIKRTENKKNTLPCAHELVAQIDSNLRHLQGQKKILQSMKGHRTRTEKPYHTNLKHPRTSDVKFGYKASCQHVCDDAFRKFAEKVCVKVVDSSTQIGSSLYSPKSNKNNKGHPCRDKETHTNYPTKTTEFGQNEHLNGDGSSTPTGSKTHKNNTVIKRVNLSTPVDVSRRTLGTTPRGLDIPKPTLEPRQQSQRFEIKVYEKNHFQKRSKEGKQLQEDHTFRTKYNASEETETYFIQQSKNLPGFLFDGESPREDLRPNRNTSFNLKSNKTQAKTKPSSIKGYHAKLSRDILDYANRIRALEAWNNSGEQRTCNIKQKNQETSVETNKKTIQSEKESRRRTTDILEGYDLRSTYRISEKRTEIKQRIYKHDGASINVKPDKIKTTYKTEGTKLSLQRHYFERSKDEHQPDDSEKGRSKTNDLSEASSMTRTHSVNVTRPNVIDDRTYICPDNSEDNDYLILPYKSKASEDSVHLNLSPKPTVEKYKNQNSFSKENASKSVVVLEDLSSQESQIIYSSKPSQIEECEINARIQNFNHEPQTDASNRFSGRKEFLEKNNREEISLQSSNKSENMSHNLEQTWESHIHRQGLYSSKFETSHDPRVETSSEYQSRYQLKDQVLETYPKGLSGKDSSINPSAQKVEIKSKASRSQGNSYPLTNVLSQPRSTLYEPEGALIDIEPSHSEEKLETGEQREKKDQLLEHSPNQIPNHTRSDDPLGSKRPNDDQLLCQHFSKETASQTEARSSVSSPPQQTNMEDKASQIQSPELNSAINETLTKSPVLKHVEELKQQLVEDKGKKTSEQLKSSRKEFELGAILRMNVSPRVSSSNDQIHMTQNTTLIKDPNPGLENTSSETISYKLKTIHKSDPDHMFKKSASSASGLLKSKLSESIIKAASAPVPREDTKLKYGQIQKPIPSQIFSSTKKISANDFEKSNTNEDSKTKLPKKYSPEKSYSWTLQNKLSISGNELQEQNLEQSIIGSMQKNLEESKSFNLDLVSKPNTTSTSCQDRSQSIRSSSKLQEESSELGAIPKLFVNKENMDLPVMPFKSSLSLRAKPEQGENFAREIPWSDAKINDTTKGSSLKLKPEFDSLQNEPNSTQPIYTNFESCHFAVSKSSESSSNGSELGAIPKLSPNEKILAFDEKSQINFCTLAVKPEEFEKITRKTSCNDPKICDVLMNPKQAQASLKHASKATQLSATDSQLKNNGEEVISDSPNGSELGAISNSSTNTNTYSLPTQPKVFGTRTFSRKQPKREHSSTSAEGMFLAVEPNKPLKSDAPEVHQSKKQYITDSETSTKGGLMNPEQEQTSQKHAPKATQLIATDSQLKNKADECISDSPNGSALGAISNTSTNTNTYSLPTQPKVFRSRTFSRKQIKSENSSTSIERVLFAVEPNKPLKPDEKPVLKYKTDSETSTSYRSSECGIKNSSLSKMSKNSISKSDDSRVQGSQATLKKVISQKSFPITKKPSKLFEIDKRPQTNFSRKSLPKLSQNSSFSISSKNSSDFSKHEPLPIMKASSSTSNVTQIRTSKSSSGLSNNLKTDKIKAELTHIQSSLQTEEEHSPSVSGVVKKLSNPNFEKIDHSSSLNLNKSSLNETKILKNGEENAFLSDSLNQNVNIEGVPLGVSEFIQHLQNRVRDCDVNVKKQLEEFEKHKHSCLTVVEDSKPHSSLKKEIRGQANNLEDEAIAEEFLTTSEKSVSFQQMEPLCNESVSESETDADKSCQCIFCGQDQSTLDLSEEIPSFTGCDCMKENYYKIMRIAYNK